MLNRFATMSAVVMVSWCLLLANPAPVVTALAVLALAGAVGGLHLLLASVSNPPQAIPVTVYAVPVDGWQIVQTPRVAPQPGILIDVSSEGIETEEPVALPDSDEAAYLASLPPIVPIDRANLPSRKRVRKPLTPEQREAKNRKARAAAKATRPGSKAPTPRKRAPK